MKSFSSLRVRLAATVFVATAPACALMYFTRLPWSGFVMGLLALGAAWYGGEHFILRQVRTLARAARRLGREDFSARTGLAYENGEIGELAATFDQMADALGKRAKNREEGEKALLHRSLQQTVLGALGQFALLDGDLDTLLNQAAMLCAQTLEVEYCHILELKCDAEGTGEPSGVTPNAAHLWNQPWHVPSLTSLAGVGWKKPGTHSVTAEPGSQAAFALFAGEPVVTQCLAIEQRFRPCPLLVQHRVISGAMMAIAGQGRAYGLLGAYTAVQKKFTEDEVHFLSSVATLLAMAIQRHRAELELQKLASFARLNPNAAMELTSDGNVTYFNEAAQKLASSLGVQDAMGILPPNIAEVVSTCLESGQSRTHYETQVGSRALSWAFHPMGASRVVHAYLEDITDRLSLEAQLRQSQKMESIGQLAAGVAHDFNNMLTIIQGHSGMLMTRPTLPAELSDSVQAVYFAAERAANLTRQLLMFSRKNVIQLKQVDLREVVKNMSKMLERLLGEPVRLALDLPDDSAFIQADIGMLEQVLMNLAVNARDAMPRGGKLTISTSEMHVGENFAATHPEARPGHYVTMCVTDTGCGMDSPTMRRIFEPFFTTKEVGKGTGLGLATVYGIVKQHGGWVDVSSEVDIGTTFTIYFPATVQPLAVAEGQLEEDTNEIPKGKETILVVEDEPVLRDMANMILTDCGYRVLEAGTGVEAVKVWERHQEDINLLLTDMVMPEGMSGMELAQKLVTNRPQLKVIFASGYTMDDLDPEFVRQGKAAFLQKPYTHVTLSKAVRESLDA